MKYLYNPATDSFEALEPTMRERFALGTGAESFMSPNMQYKLTGESDELRIMPPLGMAVPLGGALFIKNQLDKNKSKTEPFNQKPEQPKPPKIPVDLAQDIVFEKLVEQFKKENNIKTKRDITYTDDPSSKGYQLVNTIKNKFIEIYGRLPMQKEVNEILGGGSRKQIRNTKIPLQSGKEFKNIAMAQTKTSPEFIAKQVNKFQELSNKDKKLRIYKDNVITAEGDDYTDYIIKRAESGTRRTTTDKKFLKDKQLAKKYGVSEDQIVKANQIIYANNEIKIPEVVPETFYSRVAEERLRKGYEKLSNWEKSNVNIQDQKIKNLNKLFSQLSLDEFKNKYPQIVQDLKWKLVEGKPVLVERPDEKILKDLNTGIFSIEHGKNKATEEVDIQRLTNRYLTTKKNNNLIYSMEAYIRRNEGKSNPYIDNWLKERNLRIKVDDKYYGAPSSVMFNSNSGEHISFNKALEYYGLEGDVSGPTKKSSKVDDIKEMVDEKFGEGTITTADEAPETDSSILRKLFERFNKDNMAEGGRVGYQDGSPDPFVDQALASLNSSSVAEQFIKDNTPSLKDEIYGEDGERNLIQTFNTMFADPKAYPYYAQEIASGAANIPELAFRFPMAVLGLTRDVITGEEGKLKRAMETLDPKLTKSLKEKIGFTDMLEESRAERTGPQRTTGGILELGAEVPGPATPLFLFKLYPKLAKQLQTLTGSTAAVEKINKEIENKMATQGIDQTRRDIILATGAGGAVALLKYLGLDFLAKTPKAVKAAPEIITKGGTPKYFFDFVSLIKSKGKDITDKSATLERQKVYDYNGYELTEDISTGKISIRKDTEGGGQYTTSDGEIEAYDGIIRKEEINYEPPETILGKDGKPVKVPDQYEEATVLPDIDGGDGDFAAGLDSIDEILELLSKDGKSYSLKELEEMGINPEALPSNLKPKKAGGGIIKLAGDDSGPPPKSGPTPHGLPYVAKNVRPIKERK